MKSKFLLINKPKGWTSHDVIALLRSKLRSNSQKPTVHSQQKLRVGHAGTLDPFATGLLIVGVGREATRRLDEFKKMPKTYEAILELGATSDTQDSTGKILRFAQNDKINNQDDIQKPAKKEIKKVLKNFLGGQEQIPPMFSAKKINGKKLYDLARQGKEIKRKPVEIEIYKIKLLKYQWPYLKIQVKCSAGTYIRTLAHDIGQKLGVGAYCKELKRTRIGKFKLNQSINALNIKDFNTIDKSKIL